MWATRGSRGEAPRVVVQRGEVGRAGGRAVGPDGQHDRGELALAELGLEPVEGGPRRDLGRQDRGVRGVEPDVQERRSEDQQEEQGRDQHRDRVAHDPPGEPRPRAVRDGGRRHAAHGEAVHPRPEDGQDGRQQGQRRGDREAHHDRARDPDRAQDHELEEDQPEESQEHRQPAEEDRPAGGRDRDPDRIRRRGPGRPA